MRSVVIYESMFGNTRAVAEAIAAGLGRAGEVEVHEVGAAPERLPAGTDLVVVGGPTHAFTMSRASTRIDAASKADQPLVSPRIGIREWIGALPPAEGAVAMATFDTKVRKPKLPGSAARSADKRLRHRGYRRAVDAATFYVDGMTGPLLAGELDRAREWGRHVGSAVAAALSAR